MLSFLNMKCSQCESVYTLSVEELNIILLFKCFECEQHNLYVAGHVLGLDQQVMNEGTEQEKRRHVVETVQLFACEFAGNVLSNVDRVINVNVEIDLQEAGRRKGKRIKRKTKRRKEISGPQLSPSVQHANAPEISFEEVRDFVKIDLNLIDQKWYFERFFGDTHN
jgi:hypothetical protein